MTIIYYILPIYLLIGLVAFSCFIYRCNKLYTTPDEKLSESDRKSKVIIDSPFSNTVLEYVIDKNIAQIMYKGFSSFMFTFFWPVLLIAWLKKRKESKECVK
jgi:hypothetical protein